MSCGPRELSTATGRTQLPRNKRSRVGQDALPLSRGLPCSHAALQRASSLRAPQEGCADLRCGCGPKGSFTKSCKWNCLHKEQAQGV